MNNPTKTIPAYEPSVGQFVPYTHHVTETIISTRDLEYLSVWRIDGRTFQGYSEEEHQQWTDELNNVLRGLPLGFGLHTHFVRRRVTEYPVSDYPDTFSQAHDDSYRRVFSGKPPMINEMYLTVIVRAQVDPALKLLSRFEKRTARQVAAWQKHAIEQLNDINRKLKKVLRPYAARLLSVVQRESSTQNSTLKRAHYSEPAEFFGFLLNGKHEAVPVVQARLHNYLPTSRHFFADPGEQAEMRQAGWSRRYVMLELREYPSSSKPGHFNCLLNQPYEFTVSQSFASMSKAAGLDALSRQIKWLEDSNDFSESQIQDLKTARDEITAGKFVMGDHHATIAVYGDDGEQALRGAAELSGALAGEEIIARLVDLALIPAWASQLPGNWSWRPRPCAITSLNFLSFSSMHNYLFGKPSGNPWGAAVTMLKTVGGTPFYMNFHASQVDADDTGKRRLGNTFVLGKAGTGKTVLLGHLVTQARKFRYTAAIFDYGQGMQVTVNALGGKYFPMRVGEATGWNYFQLEPTPDNIAFMVELTCKLAADDDDDVLLAEQSRVEAAVRQLVTYIDKPQRRITTLLQLLEAAPVEGRTLSLRQRLERWAVGGQNGWVFDNPTDELDLSVDIFGFDLTDFLSRPEVRDAATMYLVHRCEQLTDGRRFAYVFDEVQNPLQVPFFQQFIQLKNRTARKENVVFLCATQEPDAISGSPVGKTLIQQAATAIYLPNPSATAADYIEDFKLSPAEYRLVKDLGEFSRQFLVKQGESTVTAELDLSTCPDSLLVFSGSADMAEIADDMKARHGSHPSQWLPHYLTAAAEALRS